MEKCIYSRYCKKKDKCRKIDREGRKEGRKEGRQRQYRWIVEEGKEEESKKTKTTEIEQAV